jgi:tripartite-type tricarboxylate transporter receptor subunit TctC
MSGLWKSRSRRCAPAELPNFSLDAAPQALAQSYPTKTVTTIVPFSSGGSADIVARGVAEHLTKSFGQRVIVTNQPKGRLGTSAQRRSRAARRTHHALGNHRPSGDQPVHVFQSPVRLVA